jgi:hypothetical protein
VLEHETFSCQDHDFWLASLMLLLLVKRCCTLVSKNARGDGRKKRRLTGWSYTDETTRGGARNPPYGGKAIGLPFTDLIIIVTYYHFS